MTIWLLEITQPVITQQKKYSVYAKALTEDYMLFMALPYDDVPVRRAP